MKHYIFEKTPLGMDKYFKTIPKIRVFIRNYLASESEEYKAGIHDQYIEANNIYKNFVTFKSFLRKELADYIDLRTHHHVAKTSFEIHELFNHWILLVYFPMHFQVDDIDIQKIGKAILTAREQVGMGRVEVANILNINARSLEAYEKGIRVMPLDIFLKLESFLPVKITNS